MGSMENKDVDADLMYVVKLPWTHSLVNNTGPHHPWKTKCTSVQVACKLGHRTGTETQLEVLDLSLNDEFEQVNIEAIISMPVIVIWSGFGGLSRIFRRLE